MLKIEVTKKIIQRESTGHGEKKGPIEIYYHRVYRETLFRDEPSATSLSSAATPEETIDIESIIESTSPRARNHALLRKLRVYT